MKKLSFVFLIATMLLSANLISAQGDVEKAASDVINAYKSKDVALLKEYMTGVMVYVVNENFFESDDAKPLVKIAEEWDGNIKEIRYSKGDVMGKTILLASVYFSDNPNGNINVALLSSYEKSDWKAFTFGISDVSKVDFEQGSKDMESEADIKVAETKISDHSEFSIEMANGDTFEKPTNEKLKELLKSLNDDNFFLILNSKEGYIQVSTSEQGYIVQYSDDGGMFEAEAYFTWDMLADIFIAYIEKDDWKSKAKWLAM